MAKVLKSPLDQILVNAGTIELAIADVDSYGVTLADGSKISFRELKESRSSIEDYSREGVVYLKARFSSPSQNGWRRVIK